jgi:hypothetical protein
MGVRRPELVLAGAVVVCLPMVPDVLSGAVSTTAALTRLLIALVVCWVLTGIVQGVVDRYADAAARREFEVQVARARAQRAQAGYMDGDPTEGMGPSATG